VFKLLSPPEIENPKDLELCLTKNFLSKKVHQAVLKHYLVIFVAIY